MADFSAVESRYAGPHTEHPDLVCGLRIVACRTVRSIAGPPRCFSVAACSATEFLKVDSVFHRHPTPSVFVQITTLNFRQKIFVRHLSQADWAILPPRIESPFLREKRSQSFITGRLIIANGPLPILTGVHLILRDASNGEIGRAHV